MDKKVEKEEAVYLEMWHIDTFEGGTGSRSTFLQNISKEYAKKTNVKVVVKTQTIMSCESFFQRGIYPDMISYGNGVKLPYSNLQKFFISSSNESSKSGYAKPWCCGGYVLIYRKNVSFDSIIITEQDNVVPLLSYYLSNVDVPIVDIVDSKNAIYTFYGQKNSALLGTQRDLYRLQNKGLDLEFQALQGYNDLFQYVSIITPNSQNICYCQAFIDFLTCEENSSKLYKIGMMAYCAEGAKNYEYPLDVYNGTRWEYVTEEVLPPEKLKKLCEMVKKYEENSESIKNALKRLK